MARWCEEGRREGRDDTAMVSMWRECDISYDCFQRMLLFRWIIKLMIIIEEDEDEEYDYKHHDYF